KYDGKKLPAGNLTTERPTGAALPSPFKFRKYGQSGIEISELFARTAAHVDDICFIRSMHANTPNHEQSMRLMNCGDERLSRPSLGAWVTYGLGSENANLPGFVVLCPGLPVADVSNWRAAFLPGVYQGTYIDTRKTKAGELLDHVSTKAVTKADQRRQLDLLAELNRRHQGPQAEDAAVEARLQSFGLAYRMQADATDAFDEAREPRKVREMYGDGVHGRQWLIARRLVERGVRVVQCYHGDVQPWDSHDNIEKNHRNLAREIDGPIAALLTDLKVRGLLDETLVICGGGVRRTPAGGIVGGEAGGGGIDGREAGDGPGPQPLGVHGLAGRRRGEGRDGVGRDGRVRLQGGGEPGPRPRPARDDPAPVRLRSRAPDLPLRRPRLPANGRLW